MSSTILKKKDLNTNRKKFKKRLFFKYWKIDQTKKSYIVN